MAPTILPGNLGTLDWSSWTRGILTALIGGGAGAVSAGFGTMVVDPKDFNIYTGKIYLVMLATFCFSGIMSMMQYLHTKPIPDVIERERVMRMTGTVPTEMKPNPPSPKFVETITEKSVTKINPE